MRGAAGMPDPTTADHDERTPSASKPGCARRAPNDLLLAKRQGTPLARHHLRWDERRASPPAALRLMPAVGSERWRANTGGACGAVASDA